MGVGGRSEQVHPVQTAEGVRAAADAPGGSGMGEGLGMGMGWPWRTRVAQGIGGSRPRRGQPGVLILTGWVVE